KQGEACDMEEGKKLLELLLKWERSTDAAERRKAWDEILSVNAEQVFSIGTVNAVLQPLTVGKKVRNVPEKGYWAWDPGGYIGLSQPATSWTSRWARPAAVQSPSAVGLSLLTKQPLRGDYDGPLLRRELAIKKAVAVEHDRRGALLEGAHDVHLVAAAHD